MAQDVKGELVLRSAGDFDSCDERDRFGAVGHQGQGFGAAGLEAAGGRVPQEVSVLRVKSVWGGAGTDGGDRAAVGGRRVWGGEVSLASDGGVAGVR